MLKALFGGHSSGGLLFVETAIDVSFGVPFDLRVEPALKTCYCFPLKELGVLLFYLEKKLLPSRSHEGREFRMTSF